MSKLRAGRLALLFTSIFALLALSAGIASAAPEPGDHAEPKPAESKEEGKGKPDTPEYKDEMTFIGDSVTAGFGYCGSENKKIANCAPNDEMGDNWLIGKTTLKACAPPDKEVPHNGCSNDNVDGGKPWNAGPWKAGPNAPDIAYPFQIAKRQTGPEKAEISDWAVTGSTPKNWDPEGGDFGPHLDRLKNQYVGMTLGANPLLAYFTYIDLGFLGVFNTKGKCVGSTSDREGWLLRKYSTIEKPINCLREKWNEEDQTQHLVNIYTKLLEQNDRVVVMGYYRDCSWSFGDWQYQVEYLPPSFGKDCKAQKREINPRNDNEISQWDQAIAVGKELNNKIQDAVMQAKEEAKKRWPDTNRDDNIVFTTPDEAEWEQHQPTSASSWIFRNDTWIHPSKAGAANLADTVEKAMCQHFDHWCGDSHEWNKQ
jgi:hypothetical protein